jgi:hypothetical protein
MIGGGLRWNLVRLSFFIVASMTFVVLAVTFPNELILPAIFGSCLGVLIAGWALLRGDRWWANAALVAGGLTMGISILLQLLYGAILQALPGLLLAYVMLLFSAEGFALVSGHYGIQSKYNQNLQSSLAMVEESLEHLTRKSSRLAALFGGCFVVSLAAISAGDVLVGTVPVLSDLSIYIVAVSVSLALLLILREE